VPTPAEVKRTIRWLRKHFKPRTPVVVRVVDTLPGCHGICYIGDGRALIRIARATRAVMDDTLIEEFAHVLRHDCPLPIINDHDALFWSIYGYIQAKWRGEEPS